MITFYILSIPILPNVKKIALESEKKMVFEPAPPYLVVRSARRTGQGEQLEGMQLAWLLRPAGCISYQLLHYWSC
jgi:hypothetical protein